MKALIMLMIVMIIIDLPAVGKPIKVEPQQYLRPDNYVTIWNVTIVMTIMVIMTITMTMTIMLSMKS